MINIKRIKNKLIVKHNGITHICKNVQEVERITGQEFSSESNTLESSEYSLSNDISVNHSGEFLLNKAV